MTFISQKIKLASYTFLNLIICFSLISCDKSYLLDDESVAYVTFDNLNLYSSNIFNNANKTNTAQQSFDEYHITYNNQTNSNTINLIFHNTQTNETAQINELAISEDIFNHIKNNNDDIDYIDVSSDGKYIIFTLKHPDTDIASNISSNTAINTVFILNIEDQTISYIKKEYMNEIINFANSSKVSDDGRYIIFSRLALENSQEMNIFIFDQMNQLTSKISSNIASAVFISNNNPSVDTRE